ncbi:UDP:flavonoid glycosyltransferase YjiC (YdhE family) [Bradyrhizobium sp. i1.3.1]
MDTSPLILLAAGGTGGHLFPAEALGVELIRRGFRVRLVTDERALRYSGLFSKDMIDVVSSETARGRNPLQLAYAGLTLAAGTLSAYGLIRRLKPVAVVGFGGYPTLPPLVAAKFAGVPSIIHDANAVLGRANRFLASRVRAIATSLPSACSTAIRRWQARPRPWARRCVRRSSPQPPCHMSRLKRTDRCACSSSAAARVRALWPTSSPVRSSALSLRYGAGSS